MGGILGGDGGGDGGAAAMMQMQIEQERERVRQEGLRIERERAQKVVQEMEARHQEGMAKLEAERKKREEDMAKAAQKQEEWVQKQLEQQKAEAEEKRREIARQYELEKAAAEKRAEEAAAAQRQHQEQFQKMFQAMNEQMAQNQENVAQMLQQLVDTQTKQDPELMEKLRETSERIAELEKEKEMADDPEQHEKLTNDRYDQFCTKLKDLAPVPKTPAPSIAVIGKSGVGKSSLINVFAGRDVCEVGNFECTTLIERKHVSPEGVEFYDVPGENDKRSYTNLQYIMGIKKMHVIIILYATRVGSVLNLVKLVKGCGVPFMVVRNKCDEFQIQRQHREKNMTFDDVLREAHDRELTDLHEEIDTSLDLFFTAASAIADDDGRWKQSREDLVKHVLEAMPKGSTGGYVNRG